MIELAKANPDPETMKVLLWLSGALILILLGIVGYFVKEKISSQRKELEGKEKGQKEQLDKLGAVVETIQKAVANLDKVVEVIRQQQDERDPRTEYRLNSHSKEIKELANRITKVETKCNINHIKE